VKKPTEDSRVIKAVLAGDVNSYGLMVKKYQKPIFNLMYRMTQNETNSMDLTQETFIKAYEQLERFKIGRSFFSWLYAIGSNLAKDHVRRRGWEARHFTSGHDEKNIACAEPCDVEGQLERRQALARLQGALGELPFEYREAVLLRYHEEMEIKEVAKAFNISVSGAKMRIHRAIKKLQAIMGDHRHDA
jgi:RNA polymerase sigma-70 factor (ECF subfamily)